MNIAAVIGWKHNHQPGMLCKELAGVMTIVEFPGGIPSQSLQDQWTGEYDTHIAAGGDKDDEATATLNTPGNQTLVDAFFELTNDIRALESKTPLTRGQVADWLKAKYRAHI